MTKRKSKNLLKFSVCNKEIETLNQETESKKQEVKNYSKVIVRNNN